MSSGFDLHGAPAILAGYRGEAGQLLCTYLSERADPRSQRSWSFVLLPQKIGTNRRHPSPGRPSPNRLSGPWAATLHLRKKRPTGKLSSPPYIPPRSLRARLSPSTQQHILQGPLSKALESPLARSYARTYARPLHALVDDIDCALPFRKPSQRRTTNLGGFFSLRSSSTSRRPKAPRPHYETSQAVLDGDSHNAQQVQSQDSWTSTLRGLAFALAITCK